VPGRGGVRDAASTANRLLVGFPKTITLLD
jgi:hypothetical protein